MSDFQNKKLQDENTPTEFISMQEASKLCSYSQEYLSLLARRGKLFSKKIGRNWFTTRKALDGYLAKQSIVITLPKNIFASVENPHQILKSNLGKPILISTEVEDKKSPTYEEFFKLNQQAISDTAPVIKPATQSQPTVAPSPVADVAPVVQSETQEKILSALNELQNQSHIHQQNELTLVQQLQNIAHVVKERDEHVASEFVQDSEIQPHSFSERIRSYNQKAKNISHSPTKLTALLITAVVAVFLLVGGFSFGNADKVLY
ncbi:MAG: helix-turn-helix domain-containing protein, partial [Candidatus Yanofskybacteria bacterium]|nr:helix-turn-helix domain-containing protein [Candidatus Yanofskybacteria bacterium]